MGPLSAYNVGVHISVSDVAFDLYTNELIYTALHLLKLYLLTVHGGLFPCNSRSIIINR